MRSALPRARIPMCEYPNPVKATGHSYCLAKIHNPMASGGRPPWLLYALHD